MYWARQRGEVDAHSAQYIVNSSLAPVILFRRRLRPVADVLKGIRNNGFTQSRWEALLRCWDAVCRHGPCAPPSVLFTLGMIGSPLTCMAFIRGFLMPWTF